MQSIADRVVLLLGLSLKHDFLAIIKSESSKQGESSPEPDVEQGFRLGEEHGSEGNSNHSTASNAKGTSPLEELFRRRDHGNSG